MSTSQPKTSTEQPLDRAIAILAAMAAAKRPLTVTDIAALCDLPVTTVHRMTAQLEKRHLVKRALGSKKLIIGPALVEMGIAAAEAVMRSDRAHQILAELSRDIGESCHIGIRADDEVVYIDTARTAPAPGLHFEPGKRSPLHCTSIGKLYLAEMPPQDFERWLAETDLGQFAPGTIVSREAFRAMIQDVREAGWAWNNEEFVTGLVGCAVPIRLPSGKLLAGLGLYVPAARRPFEEIKEFLPALRAAASRIASASVEVQGRD